MPPIIAGALVVLLDRVSKLVVQYSLAPGESVPLIPGFLFVTYVWNPGAAFGLFAYGTPFLLLATAVVITLSWAYRQKIAAGSPSLRWGVAVGLGGALGNALDRAVWGRVIDFIDVRVWPPVFNLADIAIVTGVMLIIWSMLRGSTRGDRTDRERATA